MDLRRSRRVLPRLGLGLTAALAGLHCAASHTRDDASGDAAVARGAPSDPAGDDAGPRPPAPDTGTHPPAPDPKAPVRRCRLDGPSGWVEGKTPLGRVNHPFVWVGYGGTTHSCFEMRVIAAPRPEIELSPTGDPPEDALELFLRAREGPQEGATVVHRRDGRAVRSVASVTIDHIAHAFEEDTIEEGALSAVGHFEVGAEGWAVEAEFEARYCEAANDLCI